eukprot:CAMPEP_0113866822 /NCGR_PEP_ID=MMETSP0780_2-20120614/81_1 /TAXON_ID=652834 /ORGANISM="Palpitomonas bilix" /LENGTH=1601 /DNA_ID=CAMNT_0000851705 /DNA_START=2829 /DNA_END=7632 /DNA_ORIENTATION=+ /assembly_acc=CAM_ASM_000599
MSKTLEQERICLLEKERQGEAPSQASSRPEASIVHVCSPTPSVRSLRLSGLSGPRLLPDTGHVLGVPVMVETVLEHMEAVAGKQKEKGEAEDPCRSFREVLLQVCSRVKSRVGVPLMEKLLASETLEDQTVLWICDHGLPWSYPIYTTPHLLHFGMLRCVRRMCAARQGGSLHSSLVAASQDSADWKDSPDVERFKQHVYAQMDKNVRVALRKEKEACLPFASVEEHRVLLLCEVVMLLSWDMWDAYQQLVALASPRRTENTEGNACWEESVRTLQAAPFAIVSLLQDICRESDRWSSSQRPTTQQLDLSLLLLLLRYVLPSFLKMLFQPTPVREGEEDEDSPWREIRQSVGQLFLMARTFRGRIKCFPQEMNERAFEETPDCFTVADLEAMRVDWSHISPEKYPWEEMVWLRSWLDGGTYRKEKTPREGKGSGHGSLSSLVSPPTSFPPRHLKDKKTVEEGNTGTSQQKTRISTESAFHSSSGTVLDLTEGEQPGLSRLLAWKRRNQRKDAPPGFSRKPCRTRERKQTEEEEEKGKGKEKEKEKEEEEEEEEEEVGKGFCICTSCLPRRGEPTETVIPKQDLHRFQNSPQREHDAVLRWKLSSLCLLLQVWGRKGLWWEEEGKDGRENKTATVSFQNRFSPSSPSSSPSPRRKRSCLLLPQRFARVRDQTRLSPPSVRSVEGTSFFGRVPLVYSPNRRVPGRPWAPFRVFHKPPVEHVGGFSASLPPTEASSNASSFSNVFPRHPSKANRGTRLLSRWTSSLLKSVLVIDMLADDALQIPPTQRWKVRTTPSLTGVFLKAFPILDTSLVLRCLHTRECSNAFLNHLIEREDEYQEQPWDRVKIIKETLCTRWDRREVFLFCLSVWRCWIPCGPTNTIWTPDTLRRIVQHTAAVAPAGDSHFLLSMELLMKEILCKDASTMEERRTRVTHLVELFLASGHTGMVSLCLKPPYFKFVTVSISFFRTAMCRFPSPASCETALVGVLCDLCEKQRTDTPSAPRNASFSSSLADLSRTVALPPSPTLLDRVLVFAVRKGSGETVRLLLQRGARPQYNLSASLRYAVLYEHHDLVDILCHHAIAFPTKNKPLPPFRITSAPSCRPPEDAPSLWEKSDTMSSVCKEKERNEGEKEKEGPERPSHNEGDKTEGGSFSSSCPFPRFPSSCFPEWGYGIPLFLRWCAATEQGDLTIFQPGDVTEDRSEVRGTEETWTPFCASLRSFSLCSQRSKSASPFQHNLFTWTSSPPVSRYGSSSHFPTPSTKQVHAQPCDSSSSGSAPAKKDAISLPSPPLSQEAPDAAPPRSNSSWKPGSPYFCRSLVGSLCSPCEDEKQKQKGNLSFLERWERMVEAQHWDCIVHLVWEEDMCTLSVVQLQKVLRELMDCSKEDLALVVLDVCTLVRGEVPVPCQWVLTLAFSFESLALSWWALGHGADMVLEMNQYHRYLEHLEFATTTSSSPSVFEGDGESHWFSYEVFVTEKLEDSHWHRFVNQTRTKRIQQHDITLLHPVYLRDAYVDAVQQLDHFDSLVLAHRSSVRRAQLWVDESTKNGVSSFSPHGERACASRPSGDRPPDDEGGSCTCPNGGDSEEEKVCKLSDRTSLFFSHLLW